MNRQKYYPTRIVSKRNLIIIFITALVWSNHPEISIMFAFFLLYFLFFNLSTYKVEKSEAEIKFYRILRRPKSFKWSEIELVDYETCSTCGSIWSSLFIYFFIGESSHRFNIKSFDQALFDEIVDQCRSKDIIKRDMI